MSAIVANIRFNLKKKHSEKQALRLTDRLTAISVIVAGVMQFRLLCIYGIYICCRLTVASNSLIPVTVLDLYKRLSEMTVIQKKQLRIQH